MYGIVTAIFPAVLIFCGVVMSAKLGFFHVVRPIGTLRYAFGRKFPIRELTLSLAGTLGVGNIVGVGVALHLGGAGAVFWIWVSAVFSMILKYAEIALSVRYREVTPDGIRGGTMYYMRRAFAGKTGKTIAFVFAVVALIMSVVMGNLVQMNAALSALSQVCTVNPLFLTVPTAVIAAYSIMGGFDKVTQFTSYVVPVMSICYIAVCLFAIITNAGRLPVIFGQIFSEAFRPLSCGAGIVGFVSSATVRQGVAKGAFSHEAGGGTAPLSHYCAKTDAPARQGIFGLIEVAFDTLVICTLTALIVLMYGSGADSGAELVFSSFSALSGDIGVNAVCVSIMFFAVSTVVCWGLYGIICLDYLIGKRSIAHVSYVSVYCVAIVLSVFVTEDALWRLTDIGVIIMTALNLTCLMSLSPSVRRMTEEAGLLKRKTPRKKCGR